MRSFLLRLMWGPCGREPSALRRRIGSWMLRGVPGMLTCAEFEDFVHDAHDGVLPDRTRRRFERHMALCPMCRAHFESYVRAVALGRKICETDDALPDDLPEELVGAILLARREDPSL